MIPEPTDLDRRWMRLRMGHVSHLLADPTVARPVAICVEVRRVAHKSVVARGDADKWHSDPWAARCAFCEVVEKIRAER